MSSTRSSTRKNATPVPPMQRPTRATTKLAATSAPQAVVPAQPTKANQRKPLLNRDNTSETKQTILPAKRNVVKPVPATTKAAAPKRVVTKAVEESDDREPIRAFLRIRPRGNDEEPSSVPYLSALSETSVQMTDPSPNSSRLRQLSSTSTYTFSHIFPPNTDQATFFTSTALPLVQDLLNGESGLLFAYGVTNSGKTYTIQGGAGSGEAGLLPRCLDVVFNSVDGMHSDVPLRPVRLGGIEFEPPLISEDISTGVQNAFDLAVDRDDSILAGVLAEQLDFLDRDETILQADRNFQYSIWVSYAEVYNEKIFDLLGVSTDINGGPLHRTTTIGGAFSSCMNLAALANPTPSGSDGKPLSVTRKALTLKNDPDGGKYISGLREVRVRNAEEAKAIVKMGQINRRVFGTLANTASSRSHGIFTIKVIRIHNGCPDDRDSIHTARLSIVDLAGSERTKNTNNTGDRLKEAGNINKSLMVLGQCMEALRSNQKRATVGAKPTLVPFRHSKITELFQDFFVGEGRAVMIVNVNPYDTGFDENSHVMKFAALARDVTTTTIKRAPPNVTVTAIEPPNNAAKRSIRKVMISTGGKEGKVNEAHLEVVEEDEEPDDTEDNDPPYPLVDMLFERLDEMRIKLYESEMRCALLESEIREEVTREMDERMQLMTRMFAKRMMNEVEENEMKTDRKIDLLHRMALIGSPTKSVNSSQRIRVLDLTDDEEEVSRVVNEDLSSSDDDELAIQSPLQKRLSKTPRKASSDLPRSKDDDDESMSSFTPARKANRFTLSTNAQPIIQKLEIQEGLSYLQPGDSEGEDIMTLTSGISDEDGTQSGTSIDGDGNGGDDDTEDEGDDNGGDDDTEDEEDEDEDSDFSDLETVEEEEEEVSPMLHRTSPHKQTINRASTLHLPPHKAKASLNKGKNSTVRRPSFQANLEQINPMFDDDTIFQAMGNSPVVYSQHPTQVSNTSATIIPNKQARQKTVSKAPVETAFVPNAEEVEFVKKKKRQLGKKVPVMEDEIDLVAQEADKGLTGNKKEPVRRMTTRGSK